MRPASIALLSAALAACVDEHHHHHHDDGGGAPIFVEQEPNDDPLTADHFGVLHPGDRFFIDGFVRDDLSDPFDGFAFTAGQPIHVDFQLFIQNSAADLDVSLYDPQIDQIVGTFATADNPERGGVDVFSGGLDFHLVIESFIGDAPYSLEISVLLPHLAATAEEGRPAGLAVADARAERATDAEGSYRKPAPEPRVLVEQVFEVDLERGLVIERARVLHGEL